MRPIIAIVVAGGLTAAALAWAVNHWLPPPLPADYSRIADLTWKWFEADRKAGYLAEELRLRTTERDGWKRLAVPKGTFAEDSLPGRTRRAEMTPVVIPRLVLPPVVLPPDLGPDDLIPPQNLPIPVAPVKGRP